MQYASESLAEPHETVSDRFCSRSVLSWKIHQQKSSRAQQDITFGAEWTLISSYTFTGGELPLGPLPTPKAALGITRLLLILTTII